MKTPEAWKPFLDGAEEVEDFFKNAQMLSDRKAAKKVAPKFVYLMDHGVHEALQKNNPHEGRPMTPRSAGAAVRRVMEGGGMFPYTPEEVGRILSEKLIVALEKIFPAITVTWPDGTEEEVTVRGAVKRAKEGSIDLLALVADEIEAAAIAHEQASNHLLRAVAAIKELLKRAREGNL